MSDALRRLRIAFTTVGVVVLLLQGTPTPALAASMTWMDASASVAPGQLTIDGSLTSDSQGVADAPVSILIGGREVARATTNGNGNFRATYDVPNNESGRTRVTVLFAGNEAHAASQKRLTVTLAAKPTPTPTPTRSETPRPTQNPSTPTTTQPTTPPTDTTQPTTPPTDTTQPTSPPAVTTQPGPTRATTTLSLSIDPSSAYPGDVVTVTGRLSSPSGRVAGVPIHFSIAGREQPDSLTTTGSGGSFTTFLEVPAGLSAGKVNVEATYLGSNALLATSRTARLEVKKVVVETSAPATTTPTSPPTPATSQPPAVPEDEAATESMTPVPDDTTPALPPANLGGFMVALIATGGVALMTVIGLLLRRQFSGPAADEHDFQLLGPEPDEGPPPRRQG